MTGGPDIVGPGGGRPGPEVPPAQPVRRITTPLTEDTALGLRAGDRVLLSGLVYAARDAAHARLSQTLSRGEELPLDLHDQIIYYVGPTPPPPGRAVGSAGPTTSARMDAFTPQLLLRGLRGMIGKGPRGLQVREAMQRAHAVYFVATGGAGALLGRCIVQAEVVAYPELGTEALRRLLIRDMPLLVAVDAHGGDLFQSGRAAYARDSGGAVAQ